MNNTLSNVILDVLSKLGSVVEEEVESLRREILPEKIDSFENNISEKERNILTFLFKLGDDELVELVKMQNESKKIVGIHEVKSKLLNLTIITGDQKYFNLTKVKEL